MTVNDSIKTTKGKLILLHRAYTATGDLTTTEWTVPSVFKVGMDATSATITQLDLEKPVPIGNGTICDGGNVNLTGSDGGDNSTDNTTTYKEGAAGSDVTAQNLIANDTDATKTWENADLTASGANALATKYVGVWFYIKDAAALTKFKTSGTCLEYRIGADITTNYYSKTYEASDLALGWNWLCDNELLSTWTSNGTPGTLNNLGIFITTNNTTDTFVAGDVVHDLLRQWVIGDFTKAFVSGYPLIVDANLEATTRGYLTSTEANGFLVSSFGSFNTDTTVLMDGKDGYNETSKGSTDEIIFVATDRVI